MSQNNNIHSQTNLSNLEFTQLASSSEFYSFRPTFDQNNNFSNVYSNNLDITQKRVNDSNLSYVKNSKDTNNEIVLDLNKDNYDIFKNPVLKLSIFKINNLNSEHELINVDYITPFGKKIHDL